MRTSAEPLTASEHAVIAGVVDQAPPLTEATKSRLAVLLRPAGARDLTDAIRSTMRGAA